MISVSEAKKIISDSCTHRKEEYIKLSQSLGYVLATAIYSPVNTPPFHQSSMDGFAFSFEEWDGKNELKVCGEIQAGNKTNFDIRPGEAVRIFTGAAVPASADTVVMQEQTARNQETIEITNKILTKGANVRLCGSQTKKDELALNKGQVLNSGTVSFLASLGINSVKVFSKPSVSLIITGKELVQPGEEITEGRIYESNSFGLTAGLNSLGIEPTSVEIVDDNEEKIIESIKKRLECDILILTGGVSVGDYDLVVPALEKCGVKTIFHKVKQKPGKPFYFGKRNQTLVFGLPGNPGSALTCFYRYIVPAIGNFTQRSYLNEIEMPLTSSYQKKSGLTHFLKGQINNQKVAILDNQASYMMNSFAIADCLIQLEEGKELFSKDDLVSVLKLV